MITKSLGKISGISNIIQAILMIIAVIAFALTPVNQIPIGQASHSMDKFAVSYSTNPIPLNIALWSFLIMALLAVTTVMPATATLFNEEDNGFVIFGRNIGMLSAAVMVVYFAWLIIMIPERVVLYNTGDAITKAIIAANDPIPYFKWISLFMLGGVGLWVTIVAALSHVRKILPKWFVVVCIVKFTGFWIALAGIILGQISLAKIGIVLGVLIGGSIYHFWLGTTLWRMGK